MADDGELSPVIKDLKHTIAELHHEYKDKNLPVTDGSPQLYRLCAKLEHLLQFDQKEKRSLTGTRKDYWDFLCHALGKMKYGHEGITFVSSLPELRTPIGRGRAFIRYCLVHQQLADSLQICFMEPKKASEWYYSRNPFLIDDLRSAIFNHLYELNAVTFNLALKRADLDSAWPMVTGDLYKQSKQTILNHEGENKNSEIDSLNANVVLNEKAMMTQEEKPSTCNPSKQQGTGDQTSSVETSEVEVAEAREYEAKISFLENQNKELIRKLKEGSQQRAAGAVEDFQRVSNLLDSLAASEKKEIEARRLNVDLHTQTDKLTQDLQSSLRAEQKLRSHSEERDRLQQELENIKGSCDEQLKVQSERVSEQLNSNAFLNKTLQELDALVNELRQNIASKEEKIIQMIEEKVDLVEVHARELAKVDGQQRDKVARYEKDRQTLMEELNEARAKLKFKDLELNEMISEHQVTIRESAGLAKSLETLEERLQHLEAERRMYLLESQARQLQSQELQAQCQMLQQELSKREEEKDTLVLSLQLEVTKLQASERHWKEQSWGFLLSANGKEAEPSEEKRILEEKIRHMELQSEKITQKLAGQENLQKENDALSESLKSQEQSLRSTELEVEDLSKQLLLCQEQTRSLKNAVEDKEQALREKEKQIRSLKKEAEDTSVKLREALSEKTVSDARLAEILTTTATLANETSEIEIQVLAEKCKPEEALHEVKRQKNEDEVGRVLEEEYLRQVLQQISGEKGILVGELQATVALLKEKTEEAVKLGCDLEQSQTIMKNEKIALSEQLAVVQTQQDALLRQKKELEYTNLVLSEELVQLKHHMKKLKLDKLRTEETSADLEVTKEELSTSQSEKEILDKKQAEVMMELSQKVESSQRKEKSLISELENLQRATGDLEGKDLRMKNLNEEKQMLQSRLQTSEMQMTELAGLEQKEKKEAEKWKESLNDHLEKVMAEAQLKDQIVRAKESELKDLVEKLKRSRLDGERYRNMLEKTEQEAKEREEKFLETIEEQKDLIQSMKARVLDLLREKDAMWKKTAGIESQQKGSAPHDPSLCVGCRKDFKTFTRKLQCRLCRNTMCQACSVKNGKKDTYCIPCYQKGTVQVT